MKILRISLIFEQLSSINSKLYKHRILHMSGIKPLLKLNVPDKYRNSFPKKISWLTELLGRVMCLCKNINLRITIAVDRGCKKRSTTEAPPWNGG